MYYQNPQLLFGGSRFSNLYSCTFGGTGSSDQVTLGAAASLQNSVFSYGGWVKTTTNTVRQTLIDNGKTNNTTTRLMIESTGKLRFLLNNVRQLCVGGTTVSINVWHHFMVTYNSVTGAAVIYLDGISDGTATDAATMTYTSPEFTVGATQATENVSGKIYLPVFYNVILTGVQVLELKDNPYANPLTLSSSANFKTGLYFPGGTTDYPTWTDINGVNNGTLQNMASGAITTDIP